MQQLLSENDQPETSQHRSGEQQQAMGRTDSHATLGSSCHSVDRAPSPARASGSNSGRRLTSSTTDWRLAPANGRSCSAPWRSSPSVSGCVWHRWSAGPSRLGDHTRSGPSNWVLVWARLSPRRPGADWDGFPQQWTDGGGRADGWLNRCRSRSVDPGSLRDTSSPSVDPSLRCRRWLDGVCQP